MEPRSTFHKQRLLQGETYSNASIVQCGTGDRLHAFERCSSNVMQPAFDNQGNAT